MLKPNEGLAIRDVLSLQIRVAQETRAVRAIPEGPLIREALLTRVERGIHEV